MTVLHSPRWLRATLVIGLGLFAIGGAVGVYRYITRPVTFTLAVGSLDGELMRLASAISGQLAARKSSVRLRLVDAGNMRSSAQMVAAAKVDLAVVRSDVGDLAGVRSVVRVGQATVLLLARAGTGITAINDLKGRTVGVVGGDVNKRAVDALKKEYDLDRAHVTFRDVAPSDARQALASHEVGALLMVVPLTEKYLSELKSVVRPSGRSSFSLIPIDNAGAIAEADRAYESYDIPRGTVQGSPPIPADDLTSIRTSIYLVANKSLGSSRMATLTQELLDARDDLISKYPALSAISAADTDPDAYITVHPGAAAYYNGTQQSFMDRYGDDIYLTPMILGALASLVASAWRFVGMRKAPAPGPLTQLLGLSARVRASVSERELDLIESEIDDIIGAAVSEPSSDPESGMATLQTVAMRLENLIHQRRSVMTGQA